MRFTDISESLLLYPGVLEMEVLTNEILSDILVLEYSSSNIGFTPVEPDGLIEVCNSDLRLILFCNEDFPMFTEPFMDIIDKDGKLVGHDVL
jgi:hypothetical protein